MKKMFLFAMMAAATLAASAQAYYMQVNLRSGLTQTVPADSVESVTFVQEAPDNEPFNILTAECIPDDTFRQYIKANVANGAKTYTNEQAKAFTGAFILSGLKIKELTGLEYFPNLYAIMLKGCEMSSVDLTMCPNLQVIDLSNMRYLNKFNIEGLDKIETFTLNASACKKPDLSDLPSSVKELGLSELQIESIDLSRWPNLKNLNLQLNWLSAVDLSALSNLRYLELSSNADLAAIDLSGCPLLETVSLGHTPLTQIDLAGLSNLREFYAPRTKITSFDASPASATLEVLNIFSNFDLKELNITGCSALKELSISDTGIASIDLTLCPALQSLQCSNTPMATIDLSVLPDLTTFVCSFGNNVTSLIFPSESSNLKSIKIDNMPLTSLDMGKLPSLRELWIVATDLERLDISGINPDISNGLMIQYNSKLSQIRVWEGFDENEYQGMIFANAKDCKFVTEFE